MEEETQEQKEARWNKRLREQLEREEKAESGTYKDWDGTLKNESWSHQGDRLEEERRQKEEQDRNEPPTLMLTIKGEWVMKGWRKLRDILKGKGAAMLALAALSLVNVSCFTTIEAGPYGMKYTSLGGDATNVMYGGMYGPTNGMPKYDPKTGQPLPVVGNGQLYVGEINNSKSFKTGVIAIAASVISGQWAGVAADNIAAGVAKHTSSVGGTTDIAKIKGTVDTAKIAADVEKAKIAAEAAGMVP